MSVPAILHIHTHTDRYRQTCSFDGTHVHSHIQIQTDVQADRQASRLAQTGCVRCVQGLTEAVGTILHMWGDPWGMKNPSSYSSHMDVGLPACQPQRLHQELLACLIHHDNLRNSDVDMQTDLHGVAAMTSSMLWLVSAARHGMQSYPESACPACIDYSALGSCFSIVCESSSVSPIKCSLLVLVLHTSFVLFVLDSQSSHIGS